MLFNQWMLSLINCYWFKQASATPLQRAAAEGHVDIVQQLLKHGADVNHQDAVVIQSFPFIRSFIVTLAVSSIKWTDGCIGRQLGSVHDDAP